MLYVEYHIEKFGNDGQLLESWKKPSRSFLLNFIKTLYRTMSQDIGPDANMVTVFDASDDPIGVGDYKNLFYCVGGSGKSRQAQLISGTYYTYGEYLGIVVGTSLTAVSPDQDRLIAPIEHGTEPGELEYFGMLVMDEDDFNVNAGADEAYFEIERIFRNASGGSITIREIGIYTLGSVVYASNHVFCILRDVDSIEVADGEYLKIKYRIKVAS